MTLHVPFELRRGARTDEDASVESAVWLIGHMCERLGLGDLGATNLLDFGCGVKFTQAFLGKSLPIRRYTGVDVYRDMIEFLRSHVEDPRFEYFHIDAHNELYNPTGERLTEDTELPFGDRTFDVICLFSVFTHLAPSDFSVLLHLLRRHAGAQGRLFFTLFINERTPDGHGLIDDWVRNLAGREDELSNLRSSRVEAGLPAVEPFVDLDPTSPLNWAVYSEKYARSLIEDAGWRILSLSRPEPFIQHHFLCVPE
jgi:hypothetical protein